MEAPEVSQKELLLGPVLFLSFFFFFFKHDCTLCFLNIHSNTWPYMCFLKPQPVSVLDTIS